MGTRLNRKKEIVAVSLPSLIFGIIFAFSNFVVLPLAVKKSDANPYLIAQLVNTVLVFIPIFITALIYLKCEDPQWNWVAIKKRIELRQIEGKQLLLMVGTLLAAILLIIIFAIAIEFLPLPFGMEEIESISPIELRPLEGREFYFLLLLPIGFFFNFVGEELLWRGILYKRQVMLFGKWSWIVNGMLHAVFHLYMGWMAILLLPIFLAIAYTYHKTRNLWIVIIMHALVGAPVDILLILGIVG
ncbi:CAAX protease self-immunity [Natronincola peptidivorans]|uniref:CAAX protease self-immunity n=1 Tax=Natronincola peptidivorans TaxID=426128 RepID=A0A1I0FPG1_9FIRM|nr:CPBP family intramembrane glutamic endopeptidase [Natronincola peptidivorans]SET60053.1 CAAX protease self-immunity [Natronincola peptidivorans]